MQQGTEGTTIASTRLRETANSGPQACAGGGATTTLLLWADAQNQSAAYGTAVVFENAGPDPVDITIVDGAFQPGGIFGQNNGGPIPAGQLEFVGVVGGPAALRYVRAQVTINGINGATVTARIVVRDF